MRVLYYGAMLAVIAIGAFSFLTFDSITETYPRIWRIINNLSIAAVIGLYFYRDKLLRSTTRNEMVLSIVSLLAVLAGVIYPFIRFGLIR